MAVQDYRTLEERLPDRTEERSANIKAELYEHGARVTDEVLEEHAGEAYKENQYGYDNMNDRVDEHLPSGIVLPDNGKSQGKRGVMAVFRYQEDSPFLVTHNGSGYELHWETPEGTEHVSDIRLPERPAFWDEETERGTPMKAVANLYGTDCFNVCVRNRCQFWGTKSECKFCSMNTTHQLYDTVEIQKVKEDIADIAAKAFGSGHARVATFTGGSFWNHNKEMRFYIDLFDEIADRFGQDKLRDFILISMPPLDFELIDELYETGLEFLTMNMEAYSEEAFETMVPGKAKYGRDRFLDALDYAADVFGEGKAWSNIILTMGESKEDVKRGVEHFCEMGVNPGVHVFHPDLNSQLYQKDPTEADVVRDVYRHTADLLHQYGFKPFLSDNTMRSSLMWEAYYGWL